MTTAIDCKNVFFKYDTVRALEDFSLSVNQGEVVALLGPNGAGKTTAIRVLNGLLVPQNGQIKVLGFDPDSKGERVRARTGVLTETPALYERLTAQQNLSFFGTLFGLAPASIEARSKNLLEVFGLQQRATERVGTFSKGMKQRLALARALLHDPDLIFLDEPTSDLDPEAAKQVQELIREISATGKRTIILCTHRLYEAEKLCDRVAIMKQGGVAAYGSLDELRAQVAPKIHVFFRLDGKVKAESLKDLGRLPGAFEVKQQADDLISLTTDSEAHIPAMVGLLVNSGKGIIAVEPRRATLEDIYMQLQHMHTEVEL